MPRVRVKTLSAATKTLIRESHEAGNVSEAYKASQSRYLSLEGKPAMTLILASGESTLAGVYYYKELLKLDPPLLYAYETPLIQDKWVTGFNGKKVLVRRRGADGQWAATAAGKQYFKYARDEHSVTVGALRVSGNGLALVPFPPQVLSDAKFISAYISNPEATLRYQRLSTEAEQQAFVKNAAYAYLDSLSDIVIAGIDYKLLYHDSTPILWDGNRANITFSRMRVRFFDNSPTTSEVILNRPMLDFTVPEGCWRPYDLHENCVKQLEVGCGIQMIHDCYIVKKQSSGAARRKGGPNSTFTYGATITEIENEMDIIFSELGYEEGEYPFEKSWRADGTTPNMVLRYAERKSLKCYVHHKGGKIEAHVPLSKTEGPTINFSVFGNHAYWWTKKIEERGVDCSTSANKAAEQMQIKDQYRNKTVSRTKRSARSSQCSKALHTRSGAV